MNHGPFQYTPYETSPWFLPIGFGLGIASLACVIFFLMSFTLFSPRTDGVPETFGERLKDFCIALLTVAAVAALLVWGWISYLTHNGEVSNHNYKIASQNIQAKYDVKSVVWNDSETNTDYTHTGKEPTEEYRNKNRLVIETQNGKKYVFKYKINMDTYEPTLEDMPLPGGSKPDEVVSAASLEK